MQGRVARCRELSQVPRFDKVPPPPGSFSPVRVSPVRHLAWWARLGTFVFFNVQGRDKAPGRSFWVVTGLEPLDVNCMLTDTSFSSASDNDSYICLTCPTRDLIDRSMKSQSSYPTEGERSGIKLFREDDLVLPKNIHEGFPRYKVDL